MVSGTSVGALNAAGIVQHGPDFLIDLWMKIRRRDVLRGRGPGKLRAAWRLYRGRPIYDTSPLRALINRLLDADQISQSPTRLFVHATAVHRRVLSVFTNEDPDILDGIYASASLPVAFPEVSIRGVHWSDGGILGNVPLRSVVAAGATRLTVLIPDDRPEPTMMLYREFLRQRDIGRDPSTHNSIEAVSDLIDVLLDTQFERDLAALDKQLKVKVIRPTESLGSTLDFDPEHLRWLLALGSTEAARGLLARGHGNQAP
jgi:predicted acylesterase/phospholipase RssA